MCLGCCMVKNPGLALGGAGSGFGASRVLRVCLGCCVVKHPKGGFKCPCRVHTFLSGALFCFWLHLVLSTHLVQMHLVRCFVSRCIWLCQHCGFANTDFVVLSIACLCVMCVTARFANTDFVVLSIACLCVMCVTARFANAEFVVLSICRLRVCV